MSPDTIGIGNVDKAKAAIPKLEAIMRDLLGRDRDNGGLDLGFDHADAMRNAQIDALTAIDTLTAFAYAVVGRAALHEEAVR